MTHIKICGIKNEADGIAAAQAGADFIGLVFAPSPRQVSIDQARAIATAVKRSGNQTQVVGVFVNIAAPEVNRIADFCGLDRVQLSGDEPPEYSAQIRRPVIRAIRVGAEFPREMGDFNDLAPQAIYLLDAHVNGKYGGTGTRSDWELARKVSAQLPIILAGGLTPENVSGAIEKVRPWGVDVSTGVETDGAKDPAKIRAFIGAVRRTNGRKT